MSNHPDIPLKVILQQTRLLVLRHVEACGGSATMEATRKAIGAPLRQCMTVHTDVLEDAGLIEKRRGFRGRLPVVTLVITGAGRMALDRLRSLEVAA